MPEKIKDDDQLLRRIQFLHPNFIKPDGTPASSSFSLKKGEDGLSVDIERLTSYKKSILDISRFRLFAVNAGFVRSIELTPEHNPLADNPAHGLIKGSISRGKAKKLARNSVRVNYPD